MRQTWVRFIGWSEIIGGVLMILGVWQIKHVGPGNIHFVLSAITWGFAALSIVAGAQLLMEPASGMVLSLFVQGLQIVSVNAGWRYVFLAGPKLTLLIASVGLRVSAGGGGAFILTSAPQNGTLDAPGLAFAFNLSIMGRLETATWALGINLLAAYFFVRLWRLDTELTAQAERERRSATVQNAQSLPNDATADRHGESA